MAVAVPGVAAIIIVGTVAVAWPVVVVVTVVAAADNVVLAVVFIVLAAASANVVFVDLVVIEVVVFKSHLTLTVHLHHAF